MALRVNMKIPFYQTQWHGVDLIALAKKINHPLQSVADSRFYATFYQNLSEKEGLSEEWKEKRKMLVTGCLAS